MRKFFVFSFLFCVRLLGWLFYRVRANWLAHDGGDPWRNIRIVCLLNHTSLFEWLLILAAPPRFLWRAACHGVVPAAEKTLKRPVVGFFFRSLAAHVVSITRERDHTWKEVLAKIDPDSMVLILPEGRMMRRNGLDSNGQPMTVRGGIADILDATPDGRMLFAFSGGLHHVQAPGERMPHLFQTVWLNLETVAITDYKLALAAKRGPGVALKRLVVDDLERRRDACCPTPENRAAWGGPMPPRTPT